jgi:hypothetical protein
MVVNLVGSGVSLDAFDSLTQVYIWIGSVNVLFNQGSSPVNSLFNQGSSPVNALFNQGSSPVNAMFNQGSSPVNGFQTVRLLPLL